METVKQLPSPPSKENTRKAEIFKECVCVIRIPLIIIRHFWRHRFVMVNSNPTISWLCVQHGGRRCTAADGGDEEVEEEEMLLLLLL